MHGIAHRARNLKWQVLHQDLLNRRADIGSSRFELAGVGRNRDVFRNSPNLHLDIERGRAAGLHGHPFAYIILHIGAFDGDRVSARGQIGEGIEPSITGHGGDGKTCVQIASGRASAADGRAAGVGYRSLNAAICGLSSKACCRKEQQKRESAHKYLQWIPLGWFCRDFTLVNADAEVAELNDPEPSTPKYACRD